jgi:hypothetical protein
MLRPPAIRATALATAAIAIAAFATAAEATGGDGFPYRGESDQGREIKLIADGRGRVKRGAFSARTDCGPRFRPFVGEVAFRAPLDRSTAKRFRDAGSTVESDEVHTARYRWDIRGTRKGGRKIAGRFSVEIVFRRDGREFATCVAEDVAYSAKRSRRRD